MHSRRGKTPSSYRASIYCVGCGLCIGICPSKALRLAIRDYRLIPVLEPSRCLNCGLCTRYCPAILDVHLKVGNISTRIVQSFRFKNIYFAWARDPEVRYKGASGGVVTALLLYMLKYKIIDCAVVTLMRDLVAKPLITSQESTIVSATGSIYFKTFTLSLLSKVLELLSQGYRVAIVGLPCMIRAIRKVVPPVYTDKLILLGLVCYHINELWYLLYILSRHRPEKFAIPTKITSRGFGWPGMIIISYRVGHHHINVKIGQFSLWNLVPIFEFTSPLGCLYCSDHTAIDADIVFCDAWHPCFLGKDREGVSMVGIRSERGLRIFNGAIMAGFINAIPARLYDIILAQKRNFLIRPLQTIVRKLIMCRSVKPLFMFLRDKVLAFALIEELLRCVILKLLERTDLRVRFALIHILERFMHTARAGVVEEKIFQLITLNPKKFFSILKILTSNEYR